MHVQLCTTYPAYRDLMPLMTLNHCSRTNYIVKWATSEGSPCIARMTLSKAGVPNRKSQTALSWRWIKIRMNPKRTFISLAFSNWTSKYVCPAYTQLWILSHFVGLSNKSPMWCKSRRTKTRLHEDSSCLAVFFILAPCSILPQSTLVSTPASLKLLRTVAQKLRIRQGRQYRRTRIMAASDTHW